MKMKSVRANQVPYMTKPLRKAIMIQSSLKNKHKCHFLISGNKNEHLFVNVGHIKFGKVM